MRNSLDRTIHGKREAATIADAPVIAEIVEDPKAKKRPLIIDNPTSARAEAFRTLRTNIRFLSIDQRLAASS